MDESFKNDEGVAKARRRLLLKTVGIPESTAECIIIPPNEDLNGFSRKCYLEEFCEPYISKNDFLEIVENASKLASFAYSEKRDNDNKQLSPRLKLIFWTCDLFIVLFCLMSYYAAIDGSNYLRIISLVLLGIAKFPTQAYLVKAKVDRYFENINQIYTKKKIWWRIVPELLYIEMRIGDEGYFENSKNENSDDFQYKIGIQDGAKSIRKSIRQPLKESSENITSNDAKSRRKKVSNKVVPFSESNSPQKHTRNCSEENERIEYKPNVSNNKARKHDDSEDFKSDDNMQTNYVSKTSTSKNNRANTGYATDNNSNNQSVIKSRMNKPEYLSSEGLKESSKIQEKIHIDEIEEEIKDVYKPSPYEFHDEEE